MSLLLRRRREGATDATGAHPKQVEWDGVDVDEINIWEDPDGAAFVRSVTGGDETVPTVRIGTQSLVNPSPRHLLEMIRESSG